MHKLFRVQYSSFCVLENLCHVPNERTGDLVVDLICIAVLVLEQSMGQLLIFKNCNFFLKKSPLCLICTMQYWNFINVSVPGNNISGRRSTQEPSGLTGQGESTRSRSLWDRKLSRSGRAGKSVSKHFFKKTILHTVPVLTNLKSSKVRFDPILVMTFLSTLAIKSDSPKSLCSSKVDSEPETSSFHLVQQAKNYKGNPCVNNAEF